MTEKCVQFYTSTPLNCPACLPADAVLCLPVELTVSGLGYIAAVATALTQVVNNCGTQYVYTFTYDDEDVVDQQVLTSANIDGARCKDCLDTVIEGIIGQPVTLESNGAFTQLTLTDQFGTVSVIPISGSGLLLGALDGFAIQPEGAALVAGTLYMQSASALGPGLLTDVAQSILGAKTFIDPIIIPAGNIDTAELANNAVTFAKMQSIGTDTLLGRDTAGTGNVESIAVTNNIAFTGSAEIGVVLNDTAFSSITLTPTSGTFTPGTVQGWYADIGDVRHIWISAQGTLSSTPGGIAIEAVPGIGNLAARPASLSATLLEASAFSDVAIVCIAGSGAANLLQTYALGGAYPTGDVTIIVSGSFVKT